MAGYFDICGLLGSIYSTKFVAYSSLHKTSLTTYRNLLNSCLTEGSDFPSYLNRILWYRSDEPGAWFAMLPLEMVYDYDPIPPRPQFPRPDPIGEARKYTQQGASEGIHEEGQAAVDAMSEGLSNDSGNPIEDLATVGQPLAAALC